MTLIDIYAIIDIITNDMAYADTSSWRSSNRSINWNLPDEVIATVWQLDRETLRALRTRAGRQPRWHIRLDQNSSTFSAAVWAERLKARQTAGGRPMDEVVYTETGMALSTDVTCEIVEIPIDDEATRFKIELSFFGDSSPKLTSTLQIGGDSKSAVLSAADRLSLDADDREHLVMAIFSHLSRYFGDEGGMTIVHVRWVEPDLIQWLTHHVSAAAATRIQQKLAASTDLSAPPRASKRWTESVLSTAPLFKE